MELRLTEDLVTSAVDLFMDTAPRTIALAGGSTPKPVYERLAEVDYPWEQVHVFFGDERCVPPNHDDSNFRMADEALLSKITAQFHPMFECDPAGYERAIHDVFGPGLPRFDLIFLGLGDDGHTASLFPGDPALQISDRLVATVERPDHPRMTLTLPVLSAAKLVLFLVKGEGKRKALSQLAAGGDIPAARVKAERVVVLADPAAGTAVR